MVTKNRWAALGFALGLATLFAAALPGAGRAQPAIRLYAMDCGHAAFTDAGPLADNGAFKGVARELIVPCFLIRHPNGDLIWDTGVAEALAGLPNGINLAGNHITMPHSLTAQLAQLGLKPGDIGYLSLSHSHLDHSGNVGLFKNALWIIGARERDWVLKDPTSAAHGPLQTARTKVLEGDGDYDVFGDGSVTIIQAPGHTPGHAVLLVRLAKAGPVLLTGDLWQLSESRRDRLVPTNNTDRAQTLVSMDKVEAVIANTHARVVREHVIEDFRALPAFPAPLD